MRKYINQQDMKQANAADVFRLIRKHGQLTRKQIEALTSLSWGAVSNITARLIDGSYITEAKLTNQNGAGRTPSCLEVNGNEHFAIGLDINSSGLRAVLMNLKNELLYSTEKKVDFSDSKQLVKNIEALVSGVISHANGKRLLCVGIAMQGLVDAQKGLIIKSALCRDETDIPIADILSEKLGIKTFIEHDPNCVLYGSIDRCDIENAILLRVDNGIGMAVMIDGKIFNRPGMFEIGHICAVKNGAKCSCGKNGCLELYSSKIGMEKQSNMPFEQLANSAKSGSAFAKEIFKNGADYLSQALLAASQMLNIQDILLCGDMFKINDLFFDKFKDEIDKFSQDRLLNLTFTDVEKAAFGAALIAVERSVGSIKNVKEESL